MEKTILSILSFILLTLTISCAPKNLTVKIIETTDVHGAVLPWDFIDNEAAYSSLSQVYSAVQTYRSDDSFETLLIDGGDIIQGQPSVYYYNFIATNETHLVSDIYNFMGYDAAAVGNHDIEAGHAVYDKLVEEFNFPWLAANAVDTSTGQPYFEPYTIINRQGVKIAVLGLITPGIPGWLPEPIWEGIEFQDMILTASNWIPLIQEKEDPDLIVGLFHSGVDYTYKGQTADQARNENATILVAEKVPGFDIIFCGHDHSLYNQFHTNIAGETVLVLNANNRANNLAVATIDFTYNPDTGEYDSAISGELIDVADNYQENKEFNQRYSDKIEKVKEFVSREIGTFSKTITSKEAIFGDSAFMALIHYIQLELTEADISFAAPLKMNTTISNGPVTVSDMFKLYKYENLLYTMQLSGQEIIDYLEYSYGLWMATMSGPDDYLLKYELDENGERIWSDRYENYELENRYYNYDSAAGINYTVDVSQPIGSRITIESLSDGSDFDPNSTYSVAINSYRGNGGGGHLEDGAGIPEDNLDDRVINSTVKDLRYYMIEWMENKGEVNPTAYGNWKVIPEDWWRSAVEREYPELFDGEIPDFHREDQ